jgi:hypothetical protein
VGEPTAALSRPDWALRTAESFFFLVTKKNMGGVYLAAAVTAAKKLP